MIDLDAEDDNIIVTRENKGNQSLAAETTTETAKAFGCEDLVVKCSVGSHDGQFGLFMEKAKGYTAGEISDAKGSGGDGIAPNKLFADLQARLSALDVPKATIGMMACSLGGKIIGSSPCSSPSSRTRRSRRRFRAG